MVDKKDILNDILIALEDNICAIYIAKTEQIGDDLFFTLSNGQTVQISVKVFDNG